MNESRLSIIGAGGHARSVINLLQNQQFEIVGIYDSSYSYQIKELISGIELKGQPNTVPSNQSLILAIGDNKKRASFYQQFKSQIYKGNIIHTTAYVANSAKIEVSNLFFGRSYINAEVAIGFNNIINTGAIIEHESKIENHNHISVGAVICGRVTIGNYCFVGASAVIKDKITIGNNVIIGAGAVVVKDLLAAGTYVGNPAKRIA